MNSTDDIRVPTSPDERFAYVLQRYDRAIAYYWRASGRNKKVYTIARYLIIVIGAAVTLFSTACIVICSKSARCASFMRDGIT